MDLFELERSSASEARTSRPRGRCGALLLCLALVLTACTAPGKQTRFRYDPDYGVESDEFRWAIGALGAPLVPGNQLIFLQNGDQFFPSMLQEMREARSSINMEMFIFEDDDIASSFADVMIERARAGVHVHLLVDAAGARFGKLGDRLQKGGVELEVYNPVRLGTLYRVNDRSHRRELIVDGRVAFTGGAAIDRRWKGDTRNRDEWRDLMVRIEGPVVAQMQAIFMEDWLHTTGEVLHGKAQFPEPLPAGNMQAQAVKSSYAEPNSMSKLLHYMLIQAARRRIWIQNAYFMPDRQIREGLIRAVRRGVNVRVMVPRRYDFPLLHHAVHYEYRRLLEGGIELCEYRPSMLHTKLMVVDDLWTTIGSMNLVNRSMALNAEANLLVLDHGFAEQAERIYQQDGGECEFIDPEVWRQRTLLERARDGVFRFLARPF